jgi:hypothetical protein
LDPEANSLRRGNLTRRVYGSNFQHIRAGSQALEAYDAGQESRSGDGRIRSLHRL